jgi:hemoglobin
MQENVMIFSRLVPVVAVAAAVVIGSIGSASAQMGGGKRSLYDRLGGYNAIVAVVDDFVGNVAADKRINKFFAKTDVPRLKRRLVEQLCQASGGPCIYLGRDMKTAHAGMGVRNKDFDALVQDLVKSLNKFKVPKAEQKEIASVLLPMRKDIVTR